MSHNSLRNDDLKKSDDVHESVPESILGQSGANQGLAAGDPYDHLLSINLAPRWTDTQLNQHILEAVRYGVRMERERILGSTAHLTIEEPGAISQVQPAPGGTP